MKYKLIIDPSKEEEIVITCHNKREIFDQIEQLISQENNNLLGYENDDIEIWRENGYWAYILNILNGGDDNVK